MAYKSSLTEPLLKDDKTDETQHDIDNIKNAIKESAKLKEDLDADPSYEPLQVKPKLEYEPESLDVPMIIAEQHQEEIQFTSKNLSGRHVLIAILPRKLPQSVCAGLLHVFGLVYYWYFVFHCVGSHWFARM